MQVQYENITGKILSSSLKEKQKVSTAAMKIITRRPELIHQLIVRCSLYINTNTLQQYHPTVVRLPNLPDSVMDGSISSLHLAPEVLLFILPLLRPLDLRERVHFLQTNFVGTSS